MTGSAPSTRAQLRQALLEKGVPAQFVDETVDLTFHAADEALAAIFRVLDRASVPRISTVALGPALGLTRHNMDVAEASLRKFMQTRGKPGHSVTIKGG